MALGRLGAAIGRAVAAHHLRGAVAEQVLDIELARVMGDSPGGERVAEAMGMDARDARGPAELAQQLLEPVRLEPDVIVQPSVASGDEERTRRRPPVGDVRGQGVAAAPREGHDAVLAALAVPDEQPLLRQGAVREVQSDRFGTVDAGVQQREEDRAIAAAHDGVGVAAGDQAGDLRGRQRRHDLAGQPHVAQAPERVVIRVAGRAQPGAEAAHLAEVAVTGVGAAGGEAGEVGDDVIGADGVRIQGCPILDEAAGEAGQRLPIGLDGAGRLALDGTAGQVGGDEGGQKGVGKGWSMARPWTLCLPGKSRQPRPGRRGCWEPQADGGSGDPAAKRRSVAHAVMLPSWRDSGADERASSGWVLSDRRAPARTERGVPPRRPRCGLPLRDQ